MPPNYRRYDCLSLFATGAGAVPAISVLRDIMNPRISRKVGREREREPETEAEAERERERECVSEMLISRFFIVLFW